MNHLDIYDIWAPEESIWSAWVKPALFSDPLLTDEPELSLSGESFSVCRPYSQDFAIIVDLPGVDAVRYGLLLAQQGFRPVPLFNAVRGERPVMDLLPILRALGGGAKLLRQMRLAPNAPPAFLLDSNRMDGVPVSGGFDNRWVALPQDLPSGTLLLHHFVRQVAVVQVKNFGLKRDTLQIVRPWRKAGLEVWVERLDGPENLEPGRLEAVGDFSLFRMALGALLIQSLNLRRNNVGAFGAVVPEAQDTGGSYGGSIYRGG